MMLADTDLACPVTYCKCNLINPAIKWITSLNIQNGKKGLQRGPQIQVVRVSAYSIYL